MNIRIIRGQDQIGGSIIEVSSAKARIILDVDPQYIIPIHTENAAWFEKNTSRTVVREQNFTL